MATDVGKPTIVNSSPAGSVHTRVPLASTPWVTAGPTAAHRSPTMCGGRPLANTTVIPADAAARSASALRAETLPCASSRVPSRSVAIRRGSMLPF